MKGCGNHGCIINPPIGVGTNGRCRCLDGLETKNRLKVTKLIVELRREIDDLHDQLNWHMNIR